MAFSPKLYKFILSKEFADSVIAWDLKNYKVERPSFGVLLDHTLAVIWHIFNQDGAELSVFSKADIAWALTFLEAIDVSTCSSTEDFDKLIEYMRKILITRYSMEDEGEIAELNKTMYDKLDDDYPSSSAFDDFMSSAQVQEDRKSRKGATVKTDEVSKCTDDALLQRLKVLNPKIQTLDDIKRIGNPQ